MYFVLEDKEKSKRHSVSWGPQGIEKETDKNHKLHKEQHTFKHA